MTSSLAIEVWGFQWMQLFQYCRVWEYWRVRLRGWLLNAAYYLKFVSTDFTLTCSRNSSLRILSSFPFQFRLFTICQLEIITNGKGELSHKYHVRFGLCGAAEYSQSCFSKCYQLSYISREWGRKPTGTELEGLPRSLFQSILIMHPGSIWDPARAAILARHWPVPHTKPH